MLPPRRQSSPLASIANAELSIDIGLGQLTIEDTTIPEWNLKSDAAGLYQRSPAWRPGRVLQLS